MTQDPNNKPADGTSTDQTNGVNDGGGTQETKPRKVLVHDETTQLSNSSRRSSTSMSVLVHDETTQLSNNSNALTDEE